MKLIYRGQTWEIKGNITIRDALKKVGLRSEAVLAMRDGKLLTEDVVVQADDVIKLVAVVSGG